MKSRFLKNYTSSVPVSETLARIERLLIRCGVSGITKEYGPRSEVVALRFQLKLVDREMAVRLPVDTQAAWEALWLDYVDSDKMSADGNRIEWNSHKKKTKAHFREQAERTAWRLGQDWLEVELSRTQLKQGEVAEIFLAYIWDGRQTLFDRIRANGYRGLLPEKVESDQPG